MNLKPFVFATALAITGTAYGESHVSYIDCNLNGLGNMTDSQSAIVFWNRFADKGRGNGGESIDIVVDLTTGDISVTCVSTADEETAGRVFLQFPNGNLVDIGPVMAGEADPDSEPGP